MTARFAPTPPHKRRNGRPFSVLQQSDWRVLSYRLPNPWSSDCLTVENIFIHGHLSSLPLQGPLPSLLSPFCVPALSEREGPDRGRTLRPEQFGASEAAAERNETNQPPEMVRGWKFLAWGRPTHVHPRAEPSRSAALDRKDSRCSSVAAAAGPALDAELAQDRAEFGYVDRFR